MVLIYEDGGGVQDANTYLFTGQVRQLLSARAFELFEALDADSQSDYLAAASGFIDRSYKWIGRIKDIQQGLSWPRIGAVFDGFELENTVPKPVVKASAAALDLMLTQGVDVFSPSNEAQVKKEKLSIIETEYFELKTGGADSYKSAYLDFNNILRGLFIQTAGNKIDVPAVRV
jgi:hypothetical protein